MSLTSQLLKKIMISLWREENNHKIVLNRMHIHIYLSHTYNEIKNKDNTWQWQRIKDDHKTSQRSPRVKVIITTRFIGKHQITRFSGLLYLKKPGATEPIQTLLVPESRREEKFLIAWAWQPTTCSRSPDDMPALSWSAYSSYRPICQPSY